MILTAMVIANAILTMILMILFISDNGRRRHSRGAAAPIERPEADRENADPAPRALKIVQEPVFRSEPDYGAKVRIAITRLENGIEPDVVATELGFSGSEMGILVASAERANRASLQNEAPLMMQK